MKDKKSLPIIKVFITLRKLWGNLCLRRKQQFLILSFLMILGAFAEAFSLSLVVPFFMAIVAPEEIRHYQTFEQLQSLTSSLKLQVWMKSLEEVSRKDLVVALALCFGVTALAAGGIRLILLWTSLRVARAAGTDLGLKIYKSILYQPYTKQISKNSSEIISGLITKVSLVALTLGFWLTVVTSFIIIFFLVLTLSVINLKVTLFVGIGLGAFYGISVLISNRSIANYSKVLSQEQNHVIKLLQESLGGIRDIILDGTQTLYSELYLKSDSIFRRAHANITFIGQSPRFIIEPAAIVVFSLLPLFFLNSKDDLFLALPTVAAVAFGMQRLFPALQQMFYAWNCIVAYQDSNNEVVELLKESLPVWAGKPLPPPLPFCREIRFEKVTFRYSLQTPVILDGLSFSIVRGSRVGFVGKSGSGKSTCLDLLMGLLEPCGGKIMIDERPLGTTNLREWQRNIAHVPQIIYLTDSTLAENIAFGVMPEKIDMNRVRLAAQQAKIADFIEKSPCGYNKIVGERGIRLSGGQRQRIGIARALYKQAQVLIFDEATNALDQDTEEEVMKSIEDLSPNLTVIIVAHRISTLKKCDQIIKLNKSETIM